MGEAKRRQLAGETEEEKVRRQQKWNDYKRFGQQMRKADRFIRGLYNPVTKEIEDCR